MYLITTATRKLLKLQKRIKAVPGGTSASKTISILQILIDKSQRDTSPKLTSVVSETLPHLKRGAIRDFLNIMEAHNYYKASSWNRTDFVYTFESGSKMEFFGVDNQDKVKGPRRDRLFINEANNIDYNSFDQLEVRTNEEVWMDWNPTNEFWYYTEIKGKRDDVDELTLTYVDNEACPESIKLSIESRKHRTGWWRVYGLGLLGEVEGRIYSGWRKLSEIPHEARLECYGLDFGYHPDPCVVIAIYYYNGGYILDEIFYRKESSNHEVASFLKNQESRRVIADCAEPKSIEEIKKYGVSIIPCKKGKDSKRFGIKLVQSLPISVTTQSVNLWKEYQNYLWFMDRNGNFIVGETDGADDCLDAARYGLSSVSSAIDKERIAIDMREFYGHNWSNNNRPINPAR